MNEGKALAMAGEAMEGMVDKSNRPLIDHSMRIMMAMETKEERIVAILHDVIEDTDKSIADLWTEGFSQEIIDAVDAISKRSTETYDEYLARVIQNPIAREVKHKDLKDNACPMRMQTLAPREQRRLTKKYDHGLLIVGNARAEAKEKAREEARKNGSM